jgi:hypothetical protein
MLIDERESAMGKSLSAVARSDADGGFEFSCLPADATCAIVAWRDGYERLVLPAMETTATGLNVSMAREGKLEIVATRSGVVANDVSATVFRTDVDSPDDDYWTGGALPVTFGNLPEGRYGIRFALKESYRDQLGVVEADVQSGQTTTVEVELDEFPAMFGSIEGTVEGGAGDVWVFARQGVALGSMNIASCDDSGAYRIDGLPPGGYSVTATNGAYQESKEVTVAAGETATLTFANK